MRAIPIVIVFVGFAATVCAQFMEVKGAPPQKANISFWDKTMDFLTLKYSTSQSIECTCADSNILYYHRCGPPPNSKCLFRLQNWVVPVLLLVNMTTFAVTVWISWDYCRTSKVYDRKMAEASPKQFV